MEYQGVNVDDLANVRALNRTWLRLTGRNERLAAAPFLLFSFRESDTKLWERLLGEPDQADLFIPGPNVPEGQRNLQVNGLAFLWELSRRNPYVARVVSGAPPGWCEQLSSETLVRVLVCARRYDLVSRRFPVDAPVYQHCSAHMATLQLMLTGIDRAAAGRLPAAACRMAAPARQVVDKL
jgi:hypothetical protein